VALPCIARDVVPGRQTAKLGLCTPRSYTTVGVLFLAGFFVDSVGWKWEWYIDAMAAVIMSIVGVVCLAKKEEDDLRKTPWTKLRSDID